MTTELARQDSIDVATLDIATIEKLVTSGDLKGLTPAQKIAYYRHRCEAVGIDPASQPFEYILFPKQNKLVLYAKKTASDQLVALHRIDVRITDRGGDGDTYQANARATFPDGRAVDDIGVVGVAGLAGDALANAMMKAVTKAKRRAVLSACGLGMLAEGEPESVPGARRVIVDDRGEIVGQEAIGLPKPVANNSSGHGQGSYASPIDEKRYKFFVDSFIADFNGWYVDQWTGTGGIVQGIKEPINWYSVNNHMIGWVCETRTGDLDEAIVPGDLDSRRRDSYNALAWLREPKPFASELGRYAKDKAFRVGKEWRKKHPDAKSDAPGFEALMEALEEEAMEAIDAEPVKAEDASQDPPSGPTTSAGRQPGEE